MSQSMPVLPSLVPGGSPEKANNGRPSTTPDRSSKMAKSSSVILPGKSGGGDPLAGGNSIQSGKDDWFGDFLSRQTNATQEIRLHLSKTTREFLATDLSEQIIAKTTGIVAFRQLLRRRYGSLTASWRQLFDPEGKGKVTFQHFCECCRDLGFQRKMRGLWKELVEQQGRGYMSLDQLDPEAARLMSSFRQDARVKYGSMLECWRAFDKEKSTRIELEQFVERCKEMEFKGNAALLFKDLKIDHSRKFLTMQDFDETAMQCLYRGDKNMMPVKKRAPAVKADSDREIGDESPGGSGSGAKSMPPIAGAIPPKPHTADAGAMGRTKHEPRGTKHQSEEQRGQMTATRRREDEADKGLKCLEELKKQLISNFGSIYGAWRQALDLDGNGRLSFGTFCISLRNLGYGGNVKEIWFALDKDCDGFVGLSDIDPTVDEEISSYKKHVLKSYPNLLSAWQGCLDATHSGHIELKQFVQHCKEIGWDPEGKHASSLFQNLKEDRTRRFLTLRDYDIRAFNAFVRGDMEMVSEDKPVSGPISGMDFQTRQDNCFSQRWARMNAKLDRSDLEKAATSNKKLDKAACSVEGTKNLLLRRFGTMAAAWKHMDIHGNGRLPFGDFCQAMRQLGFNGDMKGAFNGLDRDGKGAVTLRDFDAEAHEQLSEFRTLLLERYGTYIKGWKAMDTNGNGVLEEEETVNACLNLGYTRDAKMLFKNLLADPGKRSICMADIDPAAMKAYWRGDFEAMSPQEKAKAQLAARKKAEQGEKDRRMEACDWASLKKQLIRKHGSITCAWRECLDHNGIGKVSVNDFGKQIRHLGFSGNIKRVFRELDEDGSGIITFNEVSPEWYSKLSHFHECMLAKYQSYEDCYRALDSHGLKTVELVDFIPFCEQLGYKHDPTAFFKQLLSTGAKHLTLEDLEAKDPIIYCIKEDNKSTQRLMRFNTDNLTTQEKAKLDIQGRLERHNTEKSLHMGSADWTSLKHQLVHKYGTITAAWRHGLDSKNNGKMGFNEFCHDCQNHNYEGNIKACFKEIDVDDRGVITFKEVDPDWFAKHKQFRDLVLTKFESYEAAWEALDSNHNRMLDVDEFASFCNQVGYTENPKALFKQLLDGPGLHSLTPEDLEAGSILVVKAEAPVSPTSSQLLKSQKSGFNSMRSGWGRSTSNLSNTSGSLGSSKKPTPEQKAAESRSSLEAEPAVISENEQL